MVKLRIGVIFGGQSKEHEVSLNSAQSIIGALNKGKYDIIPIAITKNGYWLIGEKGEQYLSSYAGLTSENAVTLQQSESLVSLNNQEKSLVNFAEGDANGKIDLIIPMVHGTFGEDGKLQGMLEMLGLPYLFSNTLASALAMNKPKTQIVAKNVGLNVLSYCTINKNEKYNLEEIVDRLSLPIVVKPVEAGSSVGIFIAKSIQELKKSIEEDFTYCESLMLEQYKKGRELTVAMMGNYQTKALPVIEIIPQISDFYDYQAKYQAGGSKHVCPAEIPEEIKKKVQADAIKSFQAIGCRDLARADFIWSQEDNKIYFLEINTIPGMTSTSLVPEAAKVDGLDFPKFLDALIRIGLKRYKKTSSRV